jgi:hypothetical protein
VILAAGFVMRLYYHLAYRPCWAGDSGGYTYPFWLWRHGYFSDGARMPLYPLFLGLMAFITHSRPFLPNSLATRAAYAAVFVQSALVLCAAVLIYDIIRKLGVRDRLAFWGALCFSLIGGLCQFEMTLLPQSLTAFSLILSCWFFVRAISKLQNCETPISDAVCAGLSFSTAVLLRTEILVFFVILLGCTALVFVLTAFRSKPRAGTGDKNGRTFRQTARIMLLLMPVAASPGILAWMSVNYLASGQIRLTTMMGYQFYQSVYNLYDRVDPQDRVFGQIMVKYYRQTNKDGQIKRDYLWNALGEIQLHANEMPIKRRKYPFRAAGRIKMMRSTADILDLGNYMEGISRKLAKQNPFTWLRNGTENFVWDTFNFNYTAFPLSRQITPVSDPRSVDVKQVLRYPALRPIAAWSQRLQAPFLSALYTCTLGLALSGPILLIRDQRPETLLVDGAVLALVLSSVFTFVSFCFLASYYLQYGAPFLGVMIVTFVYALEMLLSLRESRQGAPLALEMRVTSKI